jgi:hypothetical protein
MLLQHMAMPLPDRELKKGSAELLILSLLEDRPRHGHEIGQLIQPEYQGLYRVSSAKAFAAGWQTRPFAETAFDSLSDFYSGQSPNYLTAAREKEVLEAWKHRT